mmetsp:Transcript_35459/g.105878  ORF Transcript_35459/g.105878 Transcript_35459/m.105878 type:complete len:113 (+) Transcript_35459:876-1214(+)
MLAVPEVLRQLVVPDLLLAPLVAARDHRLVERGQALEVGVPDDAPPPLFAVARIEGHGAQRALRVVEFLKTAEAVVARDVAAAALKHGCRGDLVAECAVELRANALGEDFVR